MFNQKILIMRTHTQTFNYYGIDFDVEFNYSPAEPEVTYYSDGSGYPGCPSEFEIITIFHKGDDLTELLEDKINDMTQEFEQQLLNN